MNSSETEHGFAADTCELMSNKPVNREKEWLKYLISKISGSSELYLIELVFFCSLALFLFLTLQRWVEHPFSKDGIEQTCDVIIMAIPGDVL